MGFLILWGEPQSFIALWILPELRAKVVATLWVKERFGQGYYPLEYSSLVVCLMVKWKLKASGALYPFALAFHPRLVSERETDEKLTLVMVMDVDGVWRSVVKEALGSGHYLPLLWKGGLYPSFLLLLLLFLPQLCVPLGNASSVLRFRCFLYFKGAFVAQGNICYIHVSRIF